MVCGEPEYRPWQEDSPCFFINNKKEVNNMDEFDIEYLEEVCKCDKRYEAWVEGHKYASRGYDVPHPAIVWTEATMLVMVLRDVKFDKKYVFKTWNNGKSDVEAYFVKQTTMFLLTNGDSKLFDISRSDMKGLIRDIEDYRFFGKLRRKRMSRIDEETDGSNKIEEEKDLFGYGEIEEEESMLMVAEPCVRCRDMAVFDKRTMRSTISNLIKMCPKNDIKGITVSMSLVAYYNEVMKGGLMDELSQINNMMNVCMNRSIMENSPLDLKCPFSDEQVKSSGISKEAKIVLAVIDYMINGEYRDHLQFDCDIHDFNVALYSAMSTLGYWEGTREDYARMMKRLFGINVKVGLMSRYLQRNSDNFRNWSNYSTSIMEKRYKIATDFEESIGRVKAFKSHNY